MKSSHIEIQMVDTDVSDHCKKDALTGFLGLMLQAVLAGLAFTCLIGTIIVFYFFFLSIQTSFLLSIYNTNVNQSSTTTKTRNAVYNHKLHMRVNMNID